MQTSHVHAPLGCYYMDVICYQFTKHTVQFNLSLSNIDMQKICVTYLVSVEFCLRLETPDDAVGEVSHVEAVGVLDPVHVDAHHLQVSLVREHPIGGGAGEEIPQLLVLFFHKVWK